MGSLVQGFDPIGTMHAHAHSGVIGVFLCLVIGVSARLLPMFTLSKIQNSRRAIASFLLVTLGLMAAVISIMLQSPFKILAATLLVAGLVCYGLEVRAILRGRSRHHLDWGVHYFLTALALLVPLGGLGLYLTRPGLPATARNGQIENVYGFLALAGFVSLAIIGMLYKIIPFNVWHARYSSMIGQAKLPSLRRSLLGQASSRRLLAVRGRASAHDLGNPGGEPWLVRIGCGLLLGSVLSLVVNVAWMFTHLLQRSPAADRSREIPPAPRATGQSIVPL